MSGKNKCNNAEYEKRINTVFNLLLNGLQRFEILEYIRTKTDWNIERAQIDNYIAEANKLIYKKSKEDIDDFREKCRKRFENQYKLAMANKDIAECRRILDTANKVLGYEKINVDSKIELATETTLKNLMDSLGKGNG